MHTRYVDAVFIQKNVIETRATLKVGDTLNIFGIFSKFYVSKIIEKKKLYGVYALKEFYTYIGTDSKIHIAKNRYLGLTPDSFYLGEPILLKDPPKKEIIGFYIGHDQDYFIFCVMWNKKCSLCKRRFLCGE